MGGVTTRDLRRVLEAAEHLHSRSDAPFDRRVFLSSNLLFPDAFHGFEIFGLRDGSHTIWSDMPWPEARRAELMQRAAEIVPKEHPVFPMLRAGHAAPMRLSDHLPKQRLERTSLFQEIFAPAHTRYQIAIPFASPQYVGGLTINRGGRDYSERELDLAGLFAAHVLVAYRNEDLVREQAGCPLASAWDVCALRALGLSPREAEVLGWVGEGKRNDEVAVILGVSRRTIEAHLASIFRKLGVEHRTAALAAVKHARKA